MLTAPGQAPACAPLPGADAMWREETRFILVGETHGTVEAPAAFALAPATASPPAPRKQP